MSQKSNNVIDIETRRAFQRWARTPDGPNFIDPSEFGISLEDFDRLSEEATEGKSRWSLSRLLGGKDGNPE